MVRSWFRHVAHFLGFRSRRLPLRRDRLQPAFEQLEARWLPSAVVQTNKSDYGPGQTALITGSGFDPNEAVNLRIVHSDTGVLADGRNPWTVTTDGNGSFQTTWYVNPSDSAGASFTLSAAGVLGDSATTHFTDSTVNFTNGDANGLWTDANNWTDQSNGTHHVPLSTDDVNIPIGNSVIAPTGTTTVNSLTLSGTLNLQGTLSLSSASTINVTGTLQQLSGSSVNSSVGGSGSLTDNGVVSNNQSGVQLRLDINSFTNNGAVVALSGGRVSFNTPTLTNFVATTLTGGAWNVASGGIIDGLTAGITDIGTGTSFTVDGATSHVYSVINSTTDALSGLASIASGSTVTFQNGAILTAAATLTDSGTLTYNLNSTINITNAISGSGTLNLTSTGGAITQSAAITAATLVVNASTGITLTNAGNAVSNFSATNTTSGAISLTNTTALTIIGINQAGSGNVSVSSTGTNTALTVNQGVTGSGGSMTLQATGNLTVGTNAVITSGSGSLTLAADTTAAGLGDDGTGTLTINAADVYGANITLRGADENIATTATVGMDLVAGTISTLAGGFSSPTGLAVDAAGNLYVADDGSNRISKVTLSGSVSTFGLDSVGVALAFDPSGNLYSVNEDGRVFKYTSSGIPSTFASGLYNPTGLAIDAAGNLYVSNSPTSLVDPAGNTITKVTPGGSVSTFVSSGLNFPQGLTFDAAGNLYVANQGDNTIAKVTPAGSVSIYVNSGLNGPAQLAFDAAGNLYVANNGNNTISKVTPAGSVSTFVSNGIGYIYGLAVDAGNLYAVDSGIRGVLKIAIPAAATLTIQSSVESRPMSIGGSNNAAVAGINLTSAELARLYTASNGTITFGDSNQTGNITFTTATPATTAGAATAVVQSSTGAGQILLDDGSASGTALNGNGGTISLTAGTGGIQALSASNSTAEIATTAATVTLNTAGPVGTSSNRIQFADNSNTAQQNVIIGSTNQPSSVYLDGLGSLTLGNVSGGTANSLINVTARTNLVVAANATINSGTSAVGLGADLTAAGGDDDGSGTLTVSANAAVYGGNITLRGADEDIASTATVGNAGVSTFVSSGLSHPTALAFDLAGNLYVANTGNNTISKVTPSGTVSTFVSGSGGLNGPEGLAFDNAGNLDVANFGANTISKVTPSGTVSTFVSSGLNEPYGLAFDTAGNLYVANYGANTISEVTPSGTVSTFVSSGLSHPTALAFDLAGNLYVANTGNNTISKVTPSGTVSTFVSGSGGLNGPEGLAFDNAGNLDVANFGANTISKVTPSGTVSTFVSSGLNEPYGLAFDTAGNLYIANYGSNTTSRVTPLPVTTQLTIQSSVESRPMSLGGTNNAAVAGINLTSAELARLLTPTTGTITIGDSNQTGNITFSTATPATTAGAATVVVQSSTGAGQIVLDDGSGSGTALNGNGGTLSLTAGTGGIVELGTNHTGTADLGSATAVALTSGGALGTASLALQLTATSLTANSSANNSNQFLSALSPVTVTSLNAGAGTINLQSGTFAVNGSAASAVMVNNGATLTGTGTISGNVSNSGTVNPGTVGGAGTLTINGAFTQTTGTLSLDIGGATAGSQYDVLAVSGLATLAGTLSTTLFNAFTPTLGASIQPLTYGSRSGTFGTLTLNQGNGNSFLPAYTGTAMNLWTVPTSTTIVWTSSTGDWTTNSNLWSTGAVPTSSDIVYIPAAANITFSTGSGTVAGLNTAGAFTLSGGTLTVNGTVQTSGGGTFTLTQGTLANATVAAGTTISETNTTTGGTLSNVSVAGTLDLTTASGELVNVIGGLTLNNGTIDIGGASSYASLRFTTGNETLGGTGTVVFSGGVANQLTATGSATLTIGSGITIHGKTGQVGNSSNVVTNQGIINEDVAGGQFFVIGSNWINDTTGQIEITASGTLSLQGSFTNNGAITVNAGTAQIGNSPSDSSVWSNGATGTISATDATLNFNSHWSSSGAVTVTQSSGTMTLNLNGNFTTAGLHLSGFTNNGGTVNLNGTLDNSSNTLTLSNTTGTWYLRNGGQITNGIVVTTGSAHLAAGDTSAKLSNVTLGDGTAGHGTLDIFTGWITVSNGMTLNQGVVNVGSTGAGVFQFSGSGNQNLAGTGTVVLSNNGSNSLLASTGGGTLVIAHGITVHGSAGSIGYTGQGLINHGTINADNVGTTLYQYGNWSNASDGTVEATGGNLSLNDSFSNAGLFAVTDSHSTLTLAGVFDGTAGIGTWQHTAGTVTLSGTINLSTSGPALTLDSTTGNWNFVNGGKIQNGTIADGGAKLIVAASTAVTLNGITLSGSPLDLATNNNTGIVVSNDLTITNGNLLTLGSATTASTLTFSSGPTHHLKSTGNSTVYLANTNSSITHGSGNGVLTIDSGVTVHGIGSIGDTNGWVNNGIINADTSGTLTLNDSFSNGGTFEVSLAAIPFNADFRGA